MSTPTPTINAWRALGAALVVAVTAASAVFGTRYPWVAVLANGLCWYVGKQLGIPVERIVKLALETMQPEKVADIAVKAIASMPPEHASKATGRIIASIRPGPRNAGLPPAISFEGLDAVVATESKRPPR